MILMQLLWGSNSRTKSVIFHVRISENTAQDLLNPDDFKKKKKKKKCLKLQGSSSKGDRTNAGGAFSSKYIAMLS